METNLVIVNTEFVDPIVNRRCVKPIVNSVKLRVIVNERMDLILVNRDQGEKRPFHNDFLHFYRPSCKGKFID